MGYKKLFYYFCSPHFRIKPIFVNIFKLGLQAIKFSLTSLFGTATDTVVLWALTTYVFGDAHVQQYIFAPMISFECAVIVNYSVAYFYVWRDRISIFSIRTYLNHFWKYNISCISAFVVKMLILNAIAVATGWDPVICNLLALCVSGLLNFVLNEFVIFKKSSSGKSIEEDN